jgi:acyl dehydratase
MIPVRAKPVKIGEAWMELDVGQTSFREAKVTEEMVRGYAEITGDYNPLHFDEDFTSRTRFERLMAQGGITTGLLHAMVAMDMPGPGTVFMNQRWDFPRPVYIGDTIRATGTVKSVHPTRPIAEIEFSVTNQDGETVLEGDATVYQAEPRS